MLALTLWQPWAWAVAHAGKPVENRPWAPPDHLLGQRIAIHAGKRYDESDDWQLMTYLGHDLPAEARRAGAVVAVTTLAGWCRVRRFDHIAEAVKFAEEGEVPMSRNDGTAELWTPGAAIDGVDVIEECVNSVYATGPWCWLLRDVVAMPDPGNLKCKGHQKLWNLDPLIEVEIERQTGEVIS